MHFKKAIRPDWGDFAIPEEGHDDYWKLDDCEWLGSRHMIQSEMDKRGFYIPSGSRRPRLESLFHRMHRGLISYDQCSIPELEKFALDRGIRRRFLKPSNKTTLMRQLERADDTATFDKFADLPPELRCRIYKLYFEDLKLPPCPAQPPITEVSRLVRKEALPLFYSCCMFHIKGEIARERRTVTRGELPRATQSKGACTIRVDQDTSIFFAKTEQEHLRRIQNLHILLRYDAFTKLAWESRQYAIQIDKDSESFEVWLGDESERWRDRMTVALREAMVEINSRTMAPKPKDEDVPSFGITFDSAGSGVLVER